MQIMIIMSIRLIMWSLCTAKVLDVYYVDCVYYHVYVYYASIAYQGHYDVCTSSHAYNVFQGYT